MFCMISATEGITKRIPDFDQDYVEKQRSWREILKNLKWLSRIHDLWSNPDEFQLGWYSGLGHIINAPPRRSGDRMFHRRIRKHRVKFLVKVFYELLSWDTEKPICGFILQNGNGVNLKLLRLTSPFASTVKCLRWEQKGLRWKELHGGALLTWRESRVSEWSLALAAETCSRWK
jgi:hypothetical protein